MEAIYEITLDLHSTVSQASLAVKQGDTNRKIYIPLREGGKPYHIERGTFAVFSTITPTGKVIEDGCTIEGNKIVYEFDEALTASSGIMDVEIRIYDVNKKTIITPAFTLIVDPRAAVGEDIKEATDSFTSLDAMYNKLNGIANEVQTKLDNGEFDGVGIESIEQTVTSNEDNGVNEVTVTQTDGTQSAFEIRNGSKGTHGDDISNVEYTPSSEDGGTNYLTIERTTYPQIGGKPSVFSEDYPIKNGSRGYKGDDISNVKYVASDEDGGTNYFEIERTTYNKTDGSPSTEKVQYPIRNGNTGAPAGFGEISAEAEVIDIDSAPTVEVEASGKDTAKNLKFKFGIPSDKYRVSEIQKQLNRTTAKTNALDKRVTNLEQGIIPSPFVTDDTVAYMKNVPENVKSYAEVSKIGGMTYKEGDTLKSAPVTEVESVGENILPYPFFDTTKTTAGVTYTDNGDGTIAANGKATENADFLCIGYVGNFTGDLTISGCPSGGSFDTYRIVMAAYKQDDTYINAVVDVGNGATYKNLQNVKLYVYIQVRSGVSVENLLFKPKIKLGTEVKPFTPFVRNILPIPTEVQEIDGYGEGVDETSFNYIDWEKKRFVKRVGKVDMGTLDWVNTSGFMVSTAGVVNGKANNAEVAKILCANYSNTSYNGLTPNTNKYIALRESDKKVWVMDTDYTDPTAFKSAMSGVMLYYELAEPIITDISDILPEDNFIGVEGNGIITLKNEYAYDVPSEIIYQIKGVAV